MVRRPVFIRVGPRAAPLGRLAILLFAGATAWLTAAAAHSAGAQPSPGGTDARGTAPLIYVAPVDDIIHPISAEFILDAIDTADTHGAAALIIPLETPGGLVESTRTIITRLVAARTPIVVFVGAAAGRAASAGFLITLAADVAVMAPGAHIGAAHPVSGSGEKIDETMAKKAASDVAAYARSLAQARRRNVELADQAVLQSRAFTANEALRAEPPLIDFTATDVNDILRQLDGRTISRFDGRTATLHTASARTETLEMTRRQRFLSTIAHPQIAYILFTIGLLGLTVEMWNPGSILPGVAGGLCLLLAFLAFQVLPINTAGLLLVLFGVVLLVLELKIPSFGVLGVGGATSLILGSVVMMNRTSELRVDLQLIAPAMIAFAGIFLFLGRLALNAQRRPSVTGAAAMIAETGRAQTAIPADGTGYVAAHGEVWIARATRPIDAGAPVRIVALDGLTLTVEPIEAGSSPSSSPGGPVS
jgi:membrane-bound serine protease (ClpP class)